MVWHKYNQPVWLYVSITLKRLRRVIHRQYVGTIQIYHTYITRLKNYPIDVSFWQSYRHRYAVRHTTNMQHNYIV